MLLIYLYFFSQGVLTLNLAVTSVAQETTTIGNVYCVICWYFGSVQWACLSLLICCLFCNVFIFRNILFKCYFMFVLLEMDIRYTLHYI